MRKPLTYLILVLMFCALAPLAVADNGKYYSIQGGVREIKSNYKKINEPKITIEVEPIKLKSELKKHYEAYKYTIKNESKEPLYLVQGVFEGAMNGGDAYFETRQNADEELQKTVWKHADWGLWTYGIAWAYDFIKAPFVWRAHTTRNKKMKLESLPFCRNKFFPSDFDPGDVIEKNILFPEDKPPYVRLTIRENKTGYIFTIAKEGVH